MKTLLSVPGNVLVRVILNRISDQLLTYQRPEQSGLTPKKSTIDCILALRVLMERKHQYQQSFFTAFVDFHKVFESVDQAALWDIMRLHGILSRLSDIMAACTLVLCAVVDSEKLPCGGSSSITQADCEASNCCYDSSSSTSPCYYANDVTVQCTLDGQFVVVVSENVTLPSLDLGSIQLVDSSSPSCSPVTSLSSFVMYQFPVSACGSTVQLSGGNVTYQNTMSAAITVRSGPEGSITRDSVYKLFFQCTYSGSQDVQVEAEVYTVAPPLPVVEQGPFDLELVIATDSSYGSYYVDADYPVTKTLRDPVAVEVHIVNRTDPNLVLTLGDCWVTPGPAASSQPQWSLLVNGCPYAGDNYLTSLVTVDSTSGVAYPSHYKRFVFEMFAFVDPVARQALAEKCPEKQHGNKKTSRTNTEIEGQKVVDHEIVADGAEAQGDKNKNATRAEGQENQVPPRDEPNEGGSETVDQTAAAAESVWGDIDMDEGGSNETEEKSEFKRPAQKRQGEREDRARKKIVLSQGSGSLERIRLWSLSGGFSVFAETADNVSNAGSVGEEHDDGNISDGSAASEPPELKARGGYSAQSVKEFLVNTAGKKGVDVAEFFPDIDLFLSSVRGLRRDKAASAMFDVKELVRLKNLTSKLRKQSNLNTT
ncbi:ZP4 protein, partial [Polypterus senegalus]